jgi:hypothetical protein
LTSPSVSKRLETLVVAGLLDDDAAAAAAERIGRDGATWPGVLTEMGLDSGAVETAMSILDTDATPSTPVDGSAIPTESPGRYTVFEELGRGGMGRVERAEDAVLHRSIARKALLVPHPGIRARFLREARITAQLEHPGIVPVYELGRAADGTLYYTMKEVRGRTLRDALGEATTLPERLRLLGVLVDLCQAVGYAHSKGVVHRDLKPENVMIGAFGETTVLDWGLAKSAGEPDVTELGDIDSFDAGTSGGAVSGSGSLTRAGTVLGTPKYMSPEQARGDADLDARSDVWSIGIILYELLTGDVPFDGPGESVLKQVQEGLWAPVEHLQRDCPPALAAICNKALSRDPQDRYPTADALGEELEAWRTGGRVDAHTYSAMERVRSASVRFRLALVGGLGLAVGALGGAGWMSLQRDAALEAGRADRRSAAALADLTRALADEAEGRAPDALARVRDVLADDALSGPPRAQAEALLERVWRRGDVRLLSSGAVESATWAPRGGRLAWIGERDGNAGVVLVDSDSGGGGVVPSPDGTPIRSFALSNDENTLWVGTEGGMLAGVSAVDLSVRTTVPLDGPVEDVAMADDGPETVVLAGRSGVWRAFDAGGAEQPLAPIVASATALPQTRLEFLTAEVRISGGGLQSFTARPDGVVEIREDVELESGDARVDTVIGRLETGRRITHVAMEPGGTDLALAGPDGVMLWSVAPHAAVQSNLRVCPDGSVAPVLPFPRTEDLNPPKRACP